jgi:hypothetical protein
LKRPFAAKRVLLESGSATSAQSLQQIRNKKGGRWSDTAEVSHIHNTGTQLFHGIRVFVRSAGFLAEIYYVIEYALHHVVVSTVIISDII